MNNLIFLFLPFCLFFVLPFPAYLEPLSLLKLSPSLNPPPLPSYPLLCYLSPPLPPPVPLTPPTAQLPVPLASPSPTHHTLTPLNINLLSPYPESHNDRQTKHITLTSWNRGLGRSPQRSTVKSLISKQYQSSPLKHPN